MTSRSARSPAVTDREREVLSLIEGHLTNRQIADELCLSVRTVESHVSSLMHKLQAGDRRSLARQVVRTDRPGSAAARWPQTVSSFVGRRTERSALMAALAAHRMVTVTGPGGVGKTRLTVEVAREFARGRRDGGWFVDLVRVTDPAMVLAAVAATVGVAEQPGRSLEEAVAAALAASDAVLVLDNCEHLTDAARCCVERLLAAGPSLSVVATSRARLAAPFEWVVEVPGLSVTADGGDAVELFLERARAAGGTGRLDHRQVSLICGALDGMALAVELAAGRYPSLGLDALVAGLDHRLRVLTVRSGMGSGTADRHRSLDDAIRWSYDLLPVEHQSLLRQVSAFASWFDAAAAAAVAEAASRWEVADGLARLADQHLLTVSVGEPTRYRALETIRQYADAQLIGIGEDAVVHDRHRQWCLGQLQILAGQPADEAWCVRFDRVADEVRAALVRAADGGRDRSAVALTESLAAQLVLRGQLAEAQRRYEQAADHVGPGSKRVRLLRLAAGTAAARVLGNETLRLLDAAAVEAAAAGDPVGAAADRAWMVIYLNLAPGIIADLPGAEEGARWLDQARPHSASPAVGAAIAVATASGLPGRDPAALALAHHAVGLARAAGAPLVESVAHDQKCAAHLARGQLAEAITAVRERGEVLDRVPLDASTAYQFNDYLLMASEVCLAAGDLPAAGHYADRLADLACYRELTHLATSRRIKVDALAGDLDAAAERGERFLAAWDRAGRPVARTLNVTCYAVAMAHGLRGDQERREQWIGITRLLTADPDQLTGCATGWAPTFDALVALDRGRPALALDRLCADIEDSSVWQAWNCGLWRSWYAALWVEAALLTGAADAADRRRRATPVTAQNPVAAAIVQRSVAVAAQDRDRLMRCATTFADLGCSYQQRRTVSLLDGLGPA